MAKFPRGRDKQRTPHEPCPWPPIDGYVWTVSSPKNGNAKPPQSKSHEAWPCSSHPPPAKLRGGMTEIPWSNSSHAWPKMLDQSHRLPPSRVDRTLPNGTPNVSGKLRQVYAQFGHFSVLDGTHPTLKPFTFVSCLWILCASNSTVFFAMSSPIRSRLCSSLVRYSTSDDSITPQSYCHQRPLLFQTWIDPGHWLGTGGQVGLTVSKRPVAKGLRRPSARGRLMV